MSAFQNVRMKLSTLAAPTNMVTQSIVMSMSIDGDLCTECVGHFDTPQCVEVCPVDVCLPDLNRVETEAELLAKIKK